MVRAFRLADTMAALDVALQGSAPLRILDIGSNRGVFVAAARAAWPDAELTAVEPDARVVDDYANAPNLTLRIAPIEEVPLTDRGYDLIHCSHTLEHLADPFAVLEKIAAVLTPDGVTYLEVPNIETIDRADVVEEWFIDKHLYHFSPRTFAAGLSRAGLAPASPMASGLHLATVAKCGDLTWATDNPTEVTRSIEGYAARLIENQTNLVAAARQISEMTKVGRVAVWGAGRILDSLVRIGGLDLSRLALLIDRHLVSHADILHGVSVHAPEALAGARIGHVIIASREFADQIAAEVAENCT